MEIMQYRISIDYASSVSASTNMRRRCGGWFTTLALLLAVMGPLMRQPFEDTAEIRQYVVGATNELTRMCQASLRIVPGARKELCVWPGIWKVLWHATRWH